MVESVHGLRHLLALVLFMVILILFSSISYISCLSLKVARVKHLITHVLVLVLASYCLVAHVLALFKH
jgi:hypothetical protein